MSDCGERLLSLVDSTPAHGLVDVPSGRRTITLVFDDNVVDHCVWAHNKHKIRLFAGTFQIPIRVSRSLAPGQRRKVFVTPINRIPANSRITVAVAPDFMSASGHPLGRTAIINFSTAKFTTVVRRIPRLIPAVEE